ncbi:hypothetical protein [Snodgrassella sp. CFCC 13594]|uniref:hypothetical protein n=1 Tax=Snodgrassella sp. CFCC 13594 TaxID=1775559 RepID=UPI000831B692|nr:hypothetical protein [Snodgrassella sp. CFCC 13594]
MLKKSSLGYVNWLRWLIFVSVFTPVYADVVYRDHRPDRRISVRIPTQSTTTINKTVRIYAPPGSTVIYGEIPVDSAMEGDYPSQTTIIAPSTAGLATLRMASGQCVTMGDELADGRAAVFEAPCLSSTAAKCWVFAKAG